MNGFGLAPIKAEGAAIPVDAQYTKEGTREETSWLEISFTKRKLLKLAKILRASKNPTACILASACEDTAGGMK